ncbi:MAG: hypothetical protein QXJ75_03655 [Candidatus Bathyarchaeia archaeon]
MPQIVVCGNCGHLFYRGLELKQADEFIQQYGGICPSCKKKLNFRIEDVEISAHKE